MDVWRRLKLAAINFNRLQRGQSPFSSYEEMELMVSTGTETIDDNVSSSQHEIPTEYQDHNELFREMLQDDNDQY